MSSQYGAAFGSTYVWHMYGTDFTLFLAEPAELRIFRTGDPPQYCIPTTYLNTFPVIWAIRRFYTSIFLPPPPRTQRNSAELWKYWRCDYSRYFSSKLFYAAGHGLHGIPQNLGNPGDVTTPDIFISKLFSAAAADYAKFRKTSEVLEMWLLRIFFI